MDPIEQALHRTLVARCQLGDRRALEDLFLRHAVCAWAITCGGC